MVVVVDVVVVDDEVGPGGEDVVVVVSDGSGSSGTVDASMLKGRFESRPITHWMAPSSSPWMMRASWRWFMPEGSIDSRPVYVGSGSTSGDGDIVNTDVLRNLSTRNTSPAGSNSSPEVKSRNGPSSYSTEYPGGSWRPSERNSNVTMSTHPRGSDTSASTRYTLSFPSGVWRRTVELWSRHSTTDASVPRGAVVVVVGRSITGRAARARDDAHERDESATGRRHRLTLESDSLESMTTFGLQLPNFTFPGPFADGPRVADEDMFEHVAGLAIAAEESGFESVMVMDHFWQLPPLGGPDQPILEGYTLLGALAARTERVRLGTLVTGVTYRNPALLAKMVTTLDVISRGRAFLGIGAAWYEEEHAALRLRLPAGARADATARGGGADLPGDVHRGGAQLQPAPTTASTAPRTSPGRSSRAAPRSWSAAAARSGRCGSSPATPTCATSTAAPRPSGTSSTSCAGTARTSAAIPARSPPPGAGRCMLAASDEEAERDGKIIRDVAGAEFDEQFTIGTEDQIVEQVGALVDAGLDCLIFDMAYGTADQVRQVGKRLVSEFG